MAKQKVKPITGEINPKDNQSEDISSPSELMRSWHPDLFSDTEKKTVPQLPKDVLDLHLEKITIHKQENDFEYFARKLAEKKICPNLIPQSGPVGGGDSKVDTETYPVADSISLRWYEGIGRESSQERWAFAISAKKTWRSKAKSDIDKIVNTGRRYKVIYFISSRDISDRSRANTEDELRKKYSIDIHILGRCWILERVYEDDLQQLAIDSLKISGYTSTVKETGPRDIKRQKELEELEKSILDTDRYRGVHYQLVEDCFEAVLLARSLELPRTDVEGRFERAERIAKEVGHRQQQLRIIYNHAWTEHWWYEDYQKFVELYDQVEEFAKDSNQSEDLELLFRLHCKKVFRDSQKWKSLI